MRILLLLSVLITGTCHAQTVTVMDFVKVKDGHLAETLFYYEHNWKLYRDTAVSKGYIQSYRMEQVIHDTAAFDIVLITEYKDSLQYSKSEVNFREIINALRPGGPLLMNTLQPVEFRKNLFMKITRSLFRSYPAPQIDGNPGHQE
jgi:hypothetical protein